MKVSVYPPESSPGHRLIKPQSIFSSLRCCQIRSLGLFICAGTNKSVFRFTASCHVSSPPVRGVKASPAGKLYIKRPLQKHL